MWHMLGGENALQMSALHLCCFEYIPQTMTYLPYLLTELMTKLFLEQPRLHQVC